MEVVVAGFLFLAGTTIACGRQELWKPGATGPAPAGAADAMTASGAAGTTGAAGISEATGGGAGGTPDAGVDAIQPFDDGFDVGSLPGLVLWLKATSGVTLSGGSAVKSWQDDSPSRNDVQNSGQESAAFFASDHSTWYWGGGFDVVDFRSFATMSTNDQTNGTPSLGLGTGDLLVEVVSAWRTETFDRPSPFWLGLGSGSTTRTALTFDTQSNGGPGNFTLIGLGDPLISSPNVGGKLRAVGARRAVAGGVQTVELRVDGRVDKTRTGGAPRDLGSAAFAELGPACDVAEIIVIKGPISDDALAALESHLVAKYGLK